MKYKFIINARLGWVVRIYRDRQWVVVPGGVATAPLLNKIYAWLVKNNL